MLIGVPKEIKDHEDRVGLIPSSVGELVAHGHKVVVQTSAGNGAGIIDADYVRAGAEMVADADAIWSKADLVVKVKEPLAVERRKLRAGQVFVHLSASRARS